VSRRVGPGGCRGGRAAAYLDQVLAFGLGYKRLQLGGCEGVDKTGLGHDKQQHLRSRQNGQFVRLW